MLFDDLVHIRTEEIYGFVEILHLDPNILIDYLEETDVYKTFRNL